MKVAVAFFGLPRCSEKAWPTIQQQILAQIPAGHETKLFFHFYRQTQVVNPRSSENGQLDASNYSVFENFDGILENPQDVFPLLPLEQLKQYGDAWSDDFSSLRNLLLQLRSLQQVTKLLEAYAPDVVVFARPDLVYLDPIPPHVFAMAHHYPRAVFVPNWQWGKGLNDTFSVCGKEIYRAYGNRLDEVFSYCQSKRESLHSERLLRFALLKQHADVFHLAVKAARVRIGGVLAKENYQSHTSFFGPVTNANKRFIFLTKLKTKLKTFWFLKFK